MTTPANQLAALLKELSLEKRVTTINFIRRLAEEEKLLAGCSRAARKVSDLDLLIYCLANAEALLTALGTPKIVI